MKDLITSQKYLDGELNLDERHEFEEMLKSNVDLYKELLLIKEVDETFYNHDRLIFRNKVRTLINEDIRVISGNKVASFFYKKINMVATVLLLISFICFLIFQNGKNKNERLFATYYAKYDPDIIKRSDTSVDDVFSQGIEEYLNKNYNKALSTFQTLENESRFLLSANFYSGMCYMELQNYNQAIRYFETINHTENIIKTHSTWYTALALIKLNKNEEALALLTELKENDGYYTGKATELLKKLQ